MSPVPITPVRTPHRALIYADPENLLGPHRHCPRECWEVHLEELVRSARRYEDDHLVLATGPRLVLDIGAVFPGARQLVGRGKDGADKKLLDDMDVEWTTNHYSDVIMLSGDHSFASPAAAFRKAGLRVGVIAVRGAAAHTLLSAAQWHELVEYPDSSISKELCA